MTADQQQDQELSDLYRELILDHARNPRHFGKLPDATHFAEGINPLCGDKLKMYFVIDSAGCISQARFEGSGCAISVASASLLTDSVVGKNTDFARDYLSAVISLLSDDAGLPDDIERRFEMGKLKALEGVKQFPSRVKCATLAWHALDSALQNDKKPATTE
ncbi:MAG: nitrogen fixation NifU-like protein [Woeseiaceae bacterium]|jgi:nitrogen fixation NifU-like protein